MAIKPNAVVVVLELSSWMMPASYAQPETLGAVQNLRNYMAQELSIASERINKAKTTFIELIIPQTTELANITHSIATRFHGFALEFSSTLRFADNRLQEVHCGVRLLYALLLLLGTVICQYILDRFGNTLQSSAQRFLSKGLFYVLQIFCYLCAFGILVDLFMVSVLCLQTNSLSPEWRLVFIYVLPAMVIFVYKIISRLLKILYGLFHFVKFLLHGPYLLTLAPYYIMYHVYVYRHYHKNRCGSYIVMFSFNALPVFFLGFWQMLTGLSFNSSNDIKYAESNQLLVYILLFTHLFYCIEAFILHLVYPTPDMKMINRPHQERRYYLR